MISFGGGGGGSLPPIYIIFIKREVYFKLLENKCHWEKLTRQQFRLILGSRFMPRGWSNCMTLNPGPQPNFDQKIDWLVLPHTSLD